MRHLGTVSLDQTGKLLRNSLEDGGDDLEDTIDEAQQTALHVLVVVFEDAVEHVEELDLALDNTHPAEVKFEE